MSKVWYKRFPSDYQNGVALLDADVRGVYGSLIDFMYDERGSVVNDPSRLARRCGCSTRRFNQITKELLSLGKIHEKEGRFFNKRVFKELKPDFISSLSLNYLVLIFPEWRDFKDLGEVKKLEPRIQKKNKIKKDLGIVPDDGSQARELFDYVTARLGQSVWLSWFSNCEIEAGIIYPPSKLNRTKILQNYEYILTDTGLTLGDVRTERKTA